jgi:uncharacterized phage-associated protein
MEQVLPYDPRGVANLLLDIIEEKGRRATHIDLQKLLYFAHGLYLIQFRKGLVTGYFEAWQHGPVHPTVYQSFKRAGERPITFRAERTNVVTGERSSIPLPDSPLVRDHLDRVAVSYGQLTTSQLIRISHAADAPWDLTVKRSRKAIALGMRIPEDVILLAFRKHKVAVDPTPPSGEPLEDTPYTGN